MNKDKGVGKSGSLPYLVRECGTTLPWDGSCISEESNEGLQDIGMFEVIIDILKGVFFLPQIGMHVIRPCDLDGTIRVIARYKNGVKLNEIVSFDPEITKEIRKVIVFQWMFRLKVGGVNEEYIELFRPERPGDVPSLRTEGPNGVRSCTGTFHPFVTTRTRDISSQEPILSGSDELTKPILQKWFDGDINKFSEILADMLRPYSRELLQRKIERVIGAYHPEMLKNDKIKTWLKSVYDTVFPYDQRS